jgi:hypothetical protein
MMIRQLALVAITSTLFAAGCSAPQPRTALPQESKVGDPPIVFAGSYNVERTQLTLTANEEPFMRGTFPPFTPVLNLNGTYKGVPVRAECYFSSVLSEKGGLVGLISSSVQSSNSKTGDICKMLVETEEAATLNF